MQKKKIALISVYHKPGIDVFAKELVERGYTILSSGGTATFLKEAAIPVTDTADVTGLKAILSHRVATLHPKIHGGLLALDTPEHLKEMEELDIPWINLVCCDFYPLENEVAKSEATRESVIKETDIGGPAMIRSGAKGRRIVICDPADRQKVIDWMNADEPDHDEFVNNLAAKAEWVISHYGGVSSSYHSRGEFSSMHAQRISTCKYGENAWQTPAYLFERKGNTYPLRISEWKLVGGTEPSYNNLVDLARMIQTVTHIGAGFEKNDLEIPLIAIGVKHGNCCGASVNEDDAFYATRRMLEGDLLSIHGGMVMVNFEIGRDVAEQLLLYSVPDHTKRLLDMVAAPSFTEEAIEVLSRKHGKCRLMANPYIKNAGIKMLDTSPRFRHMPGGDWLEQPNYTFVPDFSSDAIVMASSGHFKDLSKDQMNDMFVEDMLLAWAIGSTSNSNTITLVKDGQLLGNGVGQQSRVDAANLAVNRAINSQSYMGEMMRADTSHMVLAEATAYSDSFFPFHDGVEVLAQAGIRFIFTSSGSVKDTEVIEFCKRENLVLYMIPDALGRGFYAH